MTQSRDDVEYPKPLIGARFIAKFLIYAFGSLRVIGRKNLPDYQVLITINHLSYMDVPAIASQFTIKQWPSAFSAKKYKGTFLEPFFRIGSPIWIEQNAPDRRALMHALGVIKQGYNFAIAPEGHRSHTGALIQGMEGAAFLVTRANVPILPVAVWGSERTFKLPRPRVYVHIGKPYRLPEGRARGEKLREYTERIMCALAALLPESYRGVYAGHPLIEEMANIVL